MNDKETRKRRELYLGYFANRSPIDRKFADLFHLRAKLVLLEIQRDAEIEELYTPQLKAQIEQIKSDFAERIEEAKNAVDELENEIRYDCLKN